MISKPILRSHRSMRPRVFLREAPALDIAAALRSPTPSAVHLMWERTPSSDDRPWGEGTLFVEDSVEAPRAALEYCFFELHDEQQFVTFELSKTANGVTGSRLRFICEQCKSARSALYFRRDKWCCRNCHGLLYETQYTANVEPDFFLYDRLMVESRRLRRPYERRVVYERRVAKAKASLERLGAPSEEKRENPRRRITISTSYYPSTLPE